MNFKKIFFSFFSKFANSRKKKTYVTSNSNDKNLRWGVDDQPTGINEAYLVLSNEERTKKFVRPLRISYIHKNCNSTTYMSLEIAETFARAPQFYGSTFCSKCQMHRPTSEFLWEGTNEIVGT